jgi:hypothetical protein
VRNYKCLRLHCKRNSNDVLAYLISNCVYQIQCRVLCVQSCWSNTLCVNTACVRKLKFQSRLCLNVLVTGMHEHISEAACLKHISVKYMSKHFSRKHAWLFHSRCYSFKYAKVLNLTLNLLTTTIVAPPSNASKWQVGFNSAFKGLMVISEQLVQYSGLIYCCVFKTQEYSVHYVYGLHNRSECNITLVIYWACMAQSV